MRRGDGYIYIYIYIYIYKREREGEREGERERRVGCIIFLEEEKKLRSLHAFPRLS
jgi:uncharacterized protein YlbG (UPF0298 family)